MIALPVGPSIRPVWTIVAPVDVVGENDAVGSLNRFSPAVAGAPESDRYDAVLAGVVPACAVTVEVFHDIADATLFPAEEGCVAAAVERRRREYTTTRHCARRALAALGVGPVAIPRGPDGAPQWPGGVVGSLTHCAGYRAAVVAREDDLAALGIDAEPHVSLPDGVLDVVSTPGERDRLRELASAHPQTHWDTLLFSAKESVYKAFAPLTGRWLDFREAAVTFDPGGRFVARLSGSGPAPGGGRLDTFTGRYVVSRGLAATVVTVPSLLNTT